MLQVVVEQLRHGTQHTRILGEGADMSHMMNQEEERVVEITQSAVIQINTDDESRVRLTSSEYEYVEGATDSPYIVTSSAREPRD